MFQFILIYLVCHCNSYSFGFLKTRSLSHKSFTKKYQLYTATSSSPSADSIPSLIKPTNFTGKGCVLISCPGEFNHFLIKAAVFIYEHNERGSTGVILERPTAFTMGETAPGIGIFESNTLFMGGEDGSDTALMLHGFDLDGASKYIGNGIYVGGMKQARELVTTGKAVPKDFKFIFNHVEWAPGQLEQELSTGRWGVVEAPPSAVLRQDAIGSLWRQARQVVMSANATCSSGDLSSPSTAGIED